ncbi:7,8-dihydroneopterin aldolase [Rhizobium wenxiniae]|uniref:7,8-dihydroneopterin aldolase n=1 Tax=Rhizobium wenxiniae TaxID=1737357 RepID=A0A7W9Y234_9HYPH|nr:dihydroneopterin aldolase [Rhizobium wenxiniae]MBB6160590.1 dihydroneopterin aldolase [Rhizobium wenxiniae]GGF82563.1 7,8-dihydroneopterin aldolase [Rhizobium wenxiniae]
MTIFQVTLKNCAFYAHHGVFEQEKALGQRFFVDVVMDVEAGDALGSDDIEQTVHYGLVYELVEKIMTGSRRNLIETLANDVALGLTAWSPMIRRVEVAIRKPSAPIAGILDYVEVRVEHRN